MLAWCITVRIVWKNSRFNEKILWTRRIMPYICYGDCEIYDIMKGITVKRGVTLNGNANGIHP